MLRRSDPTERAATLSFWLLAAFLLILWVAGGASRADVAGQAFVRFCAWAVLIVAAICLPRPNLTAIRVPAIVLGLAALLIAIQLVPLPPGIWQALPGRAIFNEAGDLIGAAGLWRPLSISPDGTSNALQSLVVPAAVLLLAGNLSRPLHDRIVLVILGLVVAGSILGLIQFSGNRIANPFINDQAPAVSANFANRNHFALFLAVGCVLASAWALPGGAKRWKIVLASALIILFTLMILATGSRMGIVLGAVAIAVSFALISRDLRGSVKSLPPWALYSLTGIAFASLVAAVALSVSLDRAASLARVATIESEAEIRGRIWPVVIDATQRYFPVGSGFGTFDKAFRISEPDHLLAPTYVNQAHSDWLQVLLEGGIAGGALLVGALIWVGVRGAGVWLGGADPSRLHGRAGFAIILLILIASVSDYPSRTPMIMALLMLASVWLASPGRTIAGTPAGLRKATLYHPHTQVYRFHPAQAGSP